MLVDKVEIRYHDHYGFPCRGLFAKALIKKGEVVWKYEQDTEILRTYHHVDIQSEKDPEKKQAIITYSYMLDDDLYGSTYDPEEDTSYFFNHSCQPNTWYETDNYIVAMRDILPGEHVTYDYAFTETESSLHAGLHCRCGSSSCRKVLTFNDWRSPEWKEKYRGHYTSYIQKKVEETCWYNPSIILRYKADGSKGLFAATPLKKHEVALVFTGKVVGLAELLSSGPRNMELSLQVNDNLWQIPMGSGPQTADYINHSCSANCGMEDSTTVVLLQDLDVGEELTIDYGAVNSGVITSKCDNFACHCQSSACRGKVTSEDWRLPELQQRYWPYFPPFVKKLVMNDRQKSFAPAAAGLMDISDHLTVRPAHIA